MMFTKFKDGDLVIYQDSYNTYKLEILFAYTNSVKAKVIEILNKFDTNLSSNYHYYNFHNEDLELYTDELWWKLKIDEF